MPLQTNHQIKTFDQWSDKEELELVLWLGFLEDSIKNTLAQKRRWMSSRNAWDLHIFFIGVAFIVDAVDSLGKFLSSDAELWKPLKSFQKKVNRYRLNELRNDIVHREAIFKLQDRKRNPLRGSSLLILGGYNENTEEYIFGDYKIRLPEAFQVVQDLSSELGKIFASRLANFYETKQYTGSIPWSQLHSLASAMRDMENEDAPYTLDDVQARFS